MLSKYMNKYNKGITLLEILISIAILTLVSIMVIIVARPVVNYYEINRVTRGGASIIEKARVQSTYSKEASKYSVKIFSDKFVLFKGTVYDPDEPSNYVFDFGSRVELAASTLEEGDVITFDRITGRTTNSGTIKLWIPNATTSSSTIIIGKTGIIEVR